MYKPNFCSQCGTKLLRLRWHFWTSRKFCNGCARQLRKERFVPWLFATVALITTGYVAGRATRPAPPPLTIVRKADSPLTSPEDPANSSLKSQSGTNLNPVSNFSPAPSEGEVYLCGARTKKGKPCSRRVHGLIRCWQHKGMPAMWPQEKLLVKE